MSFTSITNAEVFAMTRQRRADGHARRLSDLEAKWGPTVRLYVPQPEYGPDAFLEHEPRRSPYKARPLRKRSKRGPKYDREKCLCIIQLQDRACYLCHEAFTDDAPPTMDHVWPRARGGKNAGNLLAAHRPCNALKDDRLPTLEEMKYLRQINEQLFELAQAAVEREAA